MVSSFVFSQDIDCPDHAVLRPDIDPRPVNGLIELENNLNEIGLKKKYKKNTFYLSLVFIIGLNGNADKVQIYKCERYPNCGYFLKDKKLKAELMNIISSISWEAGRINGKRVCSVLNLKIEVTEGNFKIIE